MNFFKYLTFRIASKESEKLIYKGVEAIKELEFAPQFPSLVRSMGSGILIVFGLFTWYLIISLFKVDYINWGVPVLLGVLIGVVSILTKYTHGMKKEDVNVSDRRYKSGYRVEYKLVPDYEKKIELLPKHRVFNFIEALIILGGVGLLLYFQFEIYPTLDL